MLVEILRDLNYNEINLNHITKTSTSYVKQFLIFKNKEMSYLFFSPTLKRILIIPFIFNLFFINPILAQYEEDETPQSLIDHFEELDLLWHEYSPELETYGGFKNYCTNHDYKTSVNDIIIKIHHYDSIILSKVNDPLYEMNKNERNKILKEISKFEIKYSTREFIKTLKRECHERREIEHDQKDTKNDFADNSYGGQMEVLKTELSKYSYQITKKIDHINKYLHHLELHEVDF